MRRESSTASCGKLRMASKSVLPASVGPEWLWVGREKKLGWQACLDERGILRGRTTANRKERSRMRDTEHPETYEQRVQAIQLANQPILEGFETWLRQSGLSEPTIKEHVDNIRFFARYLLLYAYSLRRLDEATEGAVYDFLEYWFPRK